MLLLFLFMLAVLARAVYAIYYLIYCNRGDFSGVVCVLDIIYFTIVTALAWWVMM